MLGVAECSAFQMGTRDVLEAATAAYDSDEARDAGISPVVVLCGRCGTEKSRSVGGRRRHLAAKTYLA